jgi:hypothetical protein
MNQQVLEAMSQNFQSKIAIGVQEKATDARTMAGQAVNHLTTTFDQTAVQKVEKLGYTLTNNVQDFITVAAQNWAAAHPLLAWFLTHPLWTVGIICLMLFLGWGLIRAIAYLSEQMWIFILQLPIKLFTRKSGFTVTYGDRKKQLISNLNRLEALRQEQDKLLQEVKAILASEL